MLRTVMLTDCFFRAEPQVGVVPTSGSVVNEIENDYFSDNTSSRCPLFCHCAPKCLRLSICSGSVFGRNLRQIPNLGELCVFAVSPVQTLLSLIVLPSEFFSKSLSLRP